MKFSLPTKRIYSKAWQDRGREDVVKWDVLQVVPNEVFRVVVEVNSSPRRQGLWVKSDKGILVNCLLCPSVVLWADDLVRDPSFSFTVFTENNRLSVYNIYEDASGQKMSQTWSSGMLIEPLPNGFRYRCNDLGFENGFDSFIFRLERLESTRR